MSDFDYDQISPGVRDLVRELRELGFDTVDSGDGSNLAAGMECALPFRHVYIRVKLWRMIEVAEYLNGRYPEARIETSWSPGEPALILVLPDGPIGPDQEGDECTKCKKGSPEGSGQTASGDESNET